MKLHPGLKPEFFDCLKGSYKGIVIESYGSGGIPFEKRNILEKVNELIDSGMVVAITTQCLEEGEDMSIYEVGRKVNQDAIIRSRNMNTEAIVPKLMWALGKNGQQAEVKRSWKRRLQTISSYKKKAGLKMKAEMTYRTEKDFLGEKKIPADVYYGFRHCGQRRTSRLQDIKSTKK